MEQISLKLWSQKDVDNLLRIGGGAGAGGGEQNPKCVPLERSSPSSIWISRQEKCEEDRAKALGAVTSGDGALFIVFFPFFCNCLNSFH